MTATGTTPLVVRGVGVRYGDLVAVTGVDLDVGEGEIVGVIGPNGAGKTSLIECLVGLRPRAGGRVEVFGIDPATGRRALAPLIGVQLQDSSFPTRTRVRELGRLYSSFYADPRSFDELLGQFGLADHAEAYVTELSGGQRQKLALVLALLGRPRMLFLDELTTGLDPAARRVTWRLLRELSAEGVSMVLSSHFMDEVEALCDRVVLLVGGRVAAQGTVGSLIDRCPDAHRYVLDEALSAALDPDTVAGLDGIVEVDTAGSSLVARGRHPAGWDALTAAIADRGLDPGGVRHRTPTLEDAFLQLTGLIPGAVGDGGGSPVPEGEEVARAH